MFHYVACSKLTFSVGLYHPTENTIYLSGLNKSFIIEIPCKFRALFHSFPAKTIEPLHAMVCSFKNGTFNVYLPKKKLFDQTKPYITIWFGSSGNSAVLLTLVRKRSCFKI